MMRRAVQLLALVRVLSSLSGVRYAVWLHFVKCNNWPKIACHGDCQRSWCCMQSYPCVVLLLLICVPKMSETSNRAVAQKTNQSSAHSYSHWLVWHQTAKSVSQHIDERKFKNGQAKRMNISSPPLQSFVGQWFLLLLCSKVTPTPSRCEIYTSVVGRGKPSFISIPAAHCDLCWNKLKKGAI